MKFAVAVSLLLASVQANAIAGSSRQLQENNQDVGYWQNEQYNAGNFDEYVKNRMSTRSFSYTGCSRGLGSDKSIYVTFRLCDQCNRGSSKGCGSGNGDYIVPLDKFAEAYSKSAWLSNVDEDALADYMDYYQEIYEQKMEYYEQMAEVNQLKYQNNYNNWLTYLEKQISNTLLSRCQYAGGCQLYENGNAQGQDANANYYQNGEAAEPEKVVVDKYGRSHYIFSQDDFMNAAEQLSQTTYNEQWLQNYEIFAEYDQDVAYNQYLQSFWSYEYDQNEIYELQQEYAQEQYEERQNEQGDYEEVAWWQMIQQLGDGDDEGENPMSYARYSCVPGETYLEMLENDGDNDGNAYGGDGEYYIGPKCSGGNLELGLFYDEFCTVESTHSVEEYLGFFPAQPTIDRCTSCLIDNEVYDPQAFAEMQGQNGNAIIPLSPLCDELLMDAGRCDRDAAVNTMMDKFWQDVVNFVSDGGQLGGQNQWDEGQDFNDYDPNQQDQDMDQQDNQADDADQQQDDQGNYADQQQDDQGNYADQQQDDQDGNADQQQDDQDDNANQQDGDQRKLASVGTMFYTNYGTAVNTCHMIDNLPDTTNALSRFAANSRQRFLHFLGWAVVALVAVALVACCFFAVKNRPTTTQALDDPILADGRYKLAEAGTVA